MLPQSSENFNWPKTATRAGLICCLSEVENLVLETILRESIFILHVYGFFHWMLRWHRCACPAVASTSLAWALRTRDTCPAQPTRSLRESFSELALIKKWFFERSLANDPLKSLEVRMTVTIQ